MSNSILENLQRKINETTDDELLALGSINLNQYQKDVVDLIKKEVEKRGLQNDVQSVIFDLFTNVDGFAGRLILLDEQLLFLSTGLKAKSRSSSGSGIIGGLGSAMHDADVDRQTAIAADLNFSALENLGSWIYYLDEILNCEAESSWLSGNSLKINVVDEEKRAITHLVRWDEISKTEQTALKLKIENAKNRFVG